MVCSFQRFFALFGERSKDFSEVAKTRHHAEVPSISFQNEPWPSSVQCEKSCISSHRDLCVGKEQGIRGQGAAPTEPRVQRTYPFSRAAPVIPPGSSSPARSNGCGPAREQGPCAGGDRRASFPGLVGLSGGRGNILGIGCGMAPKRTKSGSRQASTRRRDQPENGTLWRFIVSGREKTIKTEQRTPRTLPPRGPLSGQNEARPS